MAFLDIFKIYSDVFQVTKTGNLKIQAEVFDYNDGDYLRSDDGRVECSNELISYPGSDVDKFILSHNNLDYVRLLKDEQKIRESLHEDPKIPKYLKQKEFILNVKSYFGYWYDRKEIKAPEKGFFHSEDYRTLRLDGIKYYPTTRQAPIFEILHSNYLNGTPDMSQQTIISQIEGDAETSYKKVKEFFNWDEASKVLYKTFIKTGQRRGSIRINLK